MRPDVKGKHIATAILPLTFGRKKELLLAEEILAAAVRSCMNTLFLVILKNSMLGLKSLETKAAVKMSIEELEKLIFSDVHFVMNVGLEKDVERN